MEISVNPPLFLSHFFARGREQKGCYCTGAKKIWICSKRACGASICGMCFVFGRIWVSMEVLSAVYSAKVSAMPGSSSPQCTAPAKYTRPCSRGLQNRPDKRKY